MKHKIHIRGHHLLVGITLAIATIGLPLASGHGPFKRFDDKNVRTIVVTAKNMMFNASNPSFAIEPGERVRVVLRNEDPGMKHDLVIPEIGIRTPVLEVGEEAILEFRAPETGTFEYYCSMHSMSMRGFFFVGDAAGAELTERSQ